MILEWPGPRVSLDGLTVIMSVVSRREWWRWETLTVSRVTGPGAHQKAVFVVNETGDYYFHKLLRGFVTGDGQAMGTSRVPPKSHRLILATVQYQGRLTEFHSIALL